MPIRTAFPRRRQWARQIPVPTQFQSSKNEMVKEKSKTKQKIKINRPWRKSDHHMSKTQTLRQIKMPIRTAFPRRRGWLPQIPGPTQFQSSQNEMVKETNPKQAKNQKNQPWRKHNHHMSKTQIPGKPRCPSGPPFHGGEDGYLTFQHQRNSRARKLNGERNKSKTKQKITHNGESWS